MKTWKFGNRLRDVAIKWYRQLLIGVHTCSQILLTGVNAESGEGVVSTAIVVVIMAFLALGLWVAFKSIMGHATTTISSQISQIGQ
jgi:hypothetical protein